MNQESYTRRRVACSCPDCEYRRIETRDRLLTAAIIFAFAFIATCIWANS